MHILIAIGFQLQLTGISDCENWKVRVVLSDHYNYFTLEDSCCGIFLSVVKQFLTLGMQQLIATQSLPMPQLDRLAPVKGQTLRLHWEVVVYRCS